MDELEARKRRPTEGMLELRPPVGSLLRCYQFYVSATGTDAVADWRSSCPHRLDPAKHSISNCTHICLTVSIFLDIGQQAKGGVIQCKDLLKNIIIICFNRFTLRGRRDVKLCNG